MKRLFSSLSFFIFLLVACNHPSKTENDNNNIEEDKIISVVFNATVGPDSNWRKHILVPPPQLRDTGIYKGDRPYWDSVARVLDTAKLYVVINDTLVKFPEFQRNEVRTMIKKKEFFPTDSASLDTNYSNLMLSLLDSVAPRKFDILSLTNPYSYKIVYKSNKVYAPKFNGFRYSYPMQVILAMTFSRVVFNNEQTKAVVFINSREGAIIFSLYKLNGFWKVRYATNLWVY